MTAYESFGDLRMSAVAAFVRTAILIDNEPRAELVPARAKDNAPKAATSAAFGAAAPPPTAMGADDGQKAQLGGAVPGAPVDAAAEAAALVEDPTDRVGAHQLAVRPVTNAFAQRKITCGFYFPSDDDEDVVEVALAAARHVDATIVDWQLRRNDTAPARDLITRLIQEDRAAGGKLRLIVVYTGERGLDAECGRLLEHLTAAGLNGFIADDQGRALVAAHTLITFANKPAWAGNDLEFEGPAVRPVEWADLPNFVLTSYTALSRGLLQAFALRSIAAIRDDTHQLLAMFPPGLDAAFLAQRAGIGSPSDAVDMMKSLLVSEFAASISDHGVEDDVLGGDAAALAVKARDPAQQVRVDKYAQEPVYDAVVVRPQQGGRYIVANEASLGILVRSGLNSEIVKFTEAERKRLDLQFFANDEDGREALGRFARLATFGRELQPERRIGKRPLTLTGGVILRRRPPAQTEGVAAEPTYALCVQPGCDAVRLSEATAFPFSPMAPNANTFDLVVRADGEDRMFKVDRRPRALMMQTFVPDATSQTVLSTDDDGKPVFHTEGDAETWEFVAELRPLETQHFTTLLVGKFNRVALNSSEWLRLHRPKDNG